MPDELLNKEHCPAIKYQGLYDLYYDKEFNKSEIFVKETYNSFLTFLDRENNERVIMDPISGRYISSPTGDNKITLIIDGVANPLSILQSQLRQDGDEEFERAYKLAFGDYSQEQVSEIQDAEDGISATDDVDEIDLNNSEFIPVKRSELKSPITEEHIRELISKENISKIAEDRNMGNERATITRLRFGLHGLIAEYIENPDDDSLRKGIAESNKGHGGLWDEEKIFNFVKSNTALIDPDFKL